MPSIEKFCAPGLFDPPTYSQGIKVTQAQTILFSDRLPTCPTGPRRSAAISGRTARMKRSRRSSSRRAERWPAS